MKKNKELNKELLEELYVNQNLSTTEIGKKFGMTSEGVSYRLKKFGIEIKSIKQRVIKNALISNKENIYEISKERLEELLFQFGQRKVGEICGCSKQLVETMRKKFGIKPITKTDRIHYKLKNNFSDLQKELIYGSLLGDGCIRLSENKQSARYKETHSPKQRNYLEWKQFILREYTNKPISSGYKIWKDGRKIEELTFTTCYHKNFLEIYNMFYDKNGKKHLPDNFEEIINPFMIAIWFMDDGSFHGNNYTIASGFNEIEINRIVNVFKEKFGLECRVANNDVFNLHFDKNFFFNLIKNFIIKDMAYKIFEEQRINLPFVLSKNLEKYFNEMPENPTELEIKEISEFFKISGFPFTKPSEFDREKIIEQIKNHSDIIVDGHIKSGVGVIGNDFLLSCFPNFYDVQHDNKPSAKYLFENKLEHIISDIYKYYKKKPNKSLLRKCLLEHGKITSFRPVVAKQIYDKYGKDNMAILDPCAGWGGRMLGAYCSDKVKRYDCVDACGMTIKGLNHLKCLIDRNISNKEININYGCFEEFKSNIQYDLVFTSPPYFSKEKYSKEETQSWIKYGDYESWKNGFLKKFIENSFSLLKDDGYFIVNIDDVKIGSKNYPLKQDFIEMTKEKFELIETLYMDYSNRYNNLQHNEPIFVLKKKI